MSPEPTTLRIWPKVDTPYCRQPWKAGFMIYLISRTIFLQPYWIILYYFGRLPFPKGYSLKESLSTLSAQAVIPAVTRTGYHWNVMERHSIDVDRLNKKFKETRMEWVSVPADTAKWYKGIAVKDGCEPIPIPAVQWQKVKPTCDLIVEVGSVVCLNFHGGGLAMGNCMESDITAELPRQIIKSKQVDYVFTPDYRKVDTGPFPMQLVDCITSYAYLVDGLGIPPSNIILSGDSAGGLLCLMFVRYLRDVLEMELPRAMVLSSPLCDLSYWLGPKMQLNPSATQDICFLDIQEFGPFIANLLLRDNPISLLDSEWLSPAASTVPATKSLFLDFPPTYILAGGIEWYIHTVRELVRRFELSGVPFVYLEEEDAPHDFIVLDWFNEGKKERAVTDMIKWIDELLK